MRVHWQKINKCGARTQHCFCKQETNKGAQTELHDTATAHQQQVESVHRTGRKGGKGRWGERGQWEWEGRHVRHMRTCSTQQHDRIVKKRSGSEAFSGWVSDQRGFPTVESWAAWRRVRRLPDWGVIIVLLCFTEAAGQCCLSMDMDQASEAALKGGVYLFGWWVRVSAIFLQNCWLHLKERQEEGTKPTTVTICEPLTLTKRDLCDGFSS